MLFRSTVERLVIVSTGSQVLRRVRKAQPTVPRRIAQTGCQRRCEPPGPGKYPVGRNGGAGKGFGDHLPVRRLEPSSRRSNGYGDGEQLGNLEAVIHWLLASVFRYECL